MTRIEPIYVAALIAGVAAAVLLHVIDLPAPWPAVIALNVYAVVAWPGVSQELGVTHRTYAGGWMAAALVLVLLENIAAMTH